MATDGWDVEGEVQVMRQTRISGRKYTVQESVAELPETRYTSVDETVAAFVALVAELEELARSRDPVPAAWIEEDDEGGAEEGGDEEVPSAL